AKSSPDCRKLGLKSTTVHRHALHIKVEKAHARRHRLSLSGLDTSVSAKVSACSFLSTSFTCNYCTRTQIYSRYFKVLVLFTFTSITITMDFVSSATLEQKTRRDNGEDIQLIDPLSSPPLVHHHQSRFPGDNSKLTTPPLGGSGGGSSSSTSNPGSKQTLVSGGGGGARTTSNHGATSNYTSDGDHSLDLFSWQDGMYGSGGTTTGSTSKNTLHSSPYEHPYKKKPSATTTGGGSSSGHNKLHTPELGLEEIVMGFGLRDLGGQSKAQQRKLVKHWLVFQLCGWVCLVLLYFNESSNQQRFDSELANHCHRDPDSGICLGPEWKQVLYRDVQLGGGTGDLGEQSFDFQTTSQPATALVVVDPYLDTPGAASSSTSSGGPGGFFSGSSGSSSSSGPGPGRGADGPDVFFPPTSKARPDAETSTNTHYRVRIDRVLPNRGGFTSNPDCTGPNPSPLLCNGNVFGGATSVAASNGFMTVMQRGAHAFSVEDFSDEAKQAGTVSWRVTVSHRLPARKSSRYRIYVQDVIMDPEHIRRMTTEAQCAFEGAWKKFNEKHQGKDEDVSVLRSEWVMNLGILTSLLFLAVVYRMFEKQDPNTKHLAYVQLAKFAICDFPVQISLVGYFLNWYDRSGMRCQMCLFDVDHCQADYLFHGVNIFVVLFILASAALTSLLLVKYHRDAEKVYTDDEICMIKSLQLGAICVAILPFTTGFLMVSRDQLLFPMLWYAIVGVPCVIGWVCVA
ncbi:unnamed protein product, partial [Amoebophrya sp. A120]